MSKLTPFQFDTATVRIITTDNNEILFVARDVALALGYADSAKAVTAHCKKANSLKDIGWANHPPLENQTLDSQTKLIPESDVYRLVTRSKLESAETFQDWLFDDVLPTIRKTGSYSLQPAFQIPATFAQALRLAADTQEQLDAANAKIESDKPKVDFALAVRNVEGTCSVEEFVKAVGCGRNTMFKKLREAGYLMKSNLPYQRYIDLGLFVTIEERPYIDSKNASHPTFVTRITGKGQVTLEKKFREQLKSGLVMLQSGA